MSSPSWPRSALKVFKAFHSDSISYQAVTSCSHRERPVVVPTRARESARDVTLVSVRSGDGQSHVPYRPVRRSP
jgi:hypothetical protein